MTTASADILRANGINLVFLQRDERRNDECRAFGHQSRDLINGGLAGSCGLDDDGIFAGEKSTYGVFLSRTKRLKPKILLGNRKNMVALLSRLFLLSWMPSLCCRHSPV